MNFIMKDQDTEAIDVTKGKQDITEVANDTLQMVGDNMDLADVGANDSQVPTVATDEPKYAPAADRLPEPSNTSRVVI
ncbi:hypothetical protein SARC_03951 [Sphaeroforma arctica JP610]|uniref:Uncharacterized protein n=1 Tax=Sphaeroforma arctica JP610 TaxID=667725 RepID=A0A0L0G3Y7_9EUKA|nr:hypothetical protein SARC_03951 [Sphaeroforma arctica JP610]KNC83822.1 hypothetical protein SARC_03951 [Sphaeroforma arctica JP610]|eukprot:XP_014157724.1 hypothetical protein SARC_03951 [Sphaeroforma arctica JP610]